MVPCSIIDGDRPITLRWLFNEFNLSARESGVTIMPIGDSSSVLSIPSVEAHHAGNYTCMASNIVGKDAYSSTLIVNGNLVESE